MVEGTIRIEGAKIIFRNFSGAPTKFNAAGGKRDFSVVLEDEFAQKIIADGWSPKPLRPRDETDPPRWHLPVSVAFGGYPPKIVMIKSGHQVQLDEQTIGTLDWADIKNVDLAIRPYNYEFAGRKGVRAYLKTMYVTIEEDEFEAKYADDDEDDELPF